MKVIFVSLYGAFVVASIITHLWTVVIAYYESGFWISVITFCLPLLSELYWTYQMWGVNVLYCSMSIILMVLTIPFMVYGRGR